MSKTFIYKVKSDWLSILPLSHCKQNFQTPEKTFKKGGKKKTIALNDIYINENKKTFSLSMLKTKKKYPRISTTTHRYVPIKYKPGGSESVSPS